MTKIVSRNSNGANSGIDVNLTNSELLLMLALLHTSGFRTYGNTYAYHAYTLAEKLVTISGITTSDAARLVDPAINIYDDSGHYMSTYHYKDFRIVYK